MKSLYDDLTFIENKYHKTSEPFDPYNRMAYHGYEYPPTGFDDAEMEKGLCALEKETEGLPHPVAKARMFSYVLDHAKIDVNEKDWFVGFYNWGRPITKHTLNRWNDEVFENLKDTQDEMRLFDQTGAVAMWPDFDHVIPNWDDILTLGYVGLLERVRKYHALWREKGITEEQDAFFEGMEITYEAILRLFDRYIAYAETMTHEKAAGQLVCLKNLRAGGATSLYEALQSIYIYFILCECVDHYQTRSLGNGMDSTLLPYFNADIASGRFTKEDEKEFIGYFLLQYSAIGNYWGHPMYLAGTNEDGSSKVSEVSYLILDLYEEFRIYNPKVQIKVNYNTPKPFLYKVYDLLRKGISSFVLCSEPGYMRAVRAYGATEKEAINFELSGCYESRIRHDESSTGTGYINAAKAVELALHNGRDFKTGLQVGPATGEVSDFLTFEDFYEAFLAQWSYLIEETLRLADSFEGYLAVINPSNVYSASVERCLRRAVDGYAFGVKYNNSSILNCGFASAVNSVMAVKKLVYDDKLASIDELKKALDADWQGYEKLRAKAIRSPFKYGNAEPETDRMAEAMADYYSAKVNNRPNARGGVYKAIMHSAMQFVWQGEKTAALPDGRKAGEELSKNASPTPGSDRSGVTALISSSTVLHPYNYHESFCLDVMLHPSAVEGEDGLVAMDALLMTYVENGGMAIQFNIFHAETLRDAQAHPEKYRNLQVRVCGWNVLWNNLSKKEQDAYILRAESIR